MKLKGSRSFQQTADLRRTGGFKKSPLRSCVKVAVCNWAPDVHRMYDCQVVMNDTQQEIVGFGVWRLVPNKARYVHECSASGFLCCATQLEASWAPRQSLSKMSGTLGETSGDSPRGLTSISRQFLTVGRMPSFSRTRESSECNIRPLATCVRNLIPAFARMTKHLLPAQFQKGNDPISMPLKS